ncbi:DsbA family protein [Reinekea thalattae]|uniref:DsbA family protein n=1 Tax=Reinekea thalattae TaxID=2593301 RepID=A0A5C8Z877_9GAMM|nr:DsbA family protein [Reinekea thalattae]TXR53100.1 DsbA family protein [Reinekea thalattae]
MSAKLIYCYDPMCSWCWGFKPTWNALKTELQPLLDNGKLEIVYLLGGLAADSDEPMTAQMQTNLQGIWRHINQQLGTEFNFDFWRDCKPRRSTYPACRACLVARKFNLESDMLSQIQQAYYLNAQNPSDLETLQQCAEAIGLDKQEFIKAMQELKQANSLEKEIDQARQLQLNSFPSLALLNNNQLTHIPIDYQHTQSMKETIDQLIG